VDNLLLAMVTSVCTFFVESFAVEKE
jgi:hypothetical protein